MVKALVVKRKLHEANDRMQRWLAVSRLERLEAVETIRSTCFKSDDFQQAFPRVYKMTRKAQR